MVANARLRSHLPLELTISDPLARGDRLEHRAIRVTPPTDVVDGGGTGRLAEGLEGGDQVRAVNVVADLLAGVAEDGVWRAGYDALHQVGEEAMEFGAGVLGPGETAAAKANRGHVEVAPILLYQQIGCRLRCAKQRVRRQIDRHRRVDAL